MENMQNKSGFISHENARIYYEVEGAGIPLVMIHAGVADSRQWNNEFHHFSKELPGLSDMICADMEKVNQSKVHSVILEI